MKCLSLFKMFYPTHYILGLLLLGNGVLSVPLSTEESLENDENATEAATNETAQNLYVIKSVVYEIGILTDADEDNQTGNETHEQVDVSFFDPGHNGSIIDLSNIPLPIQTNISGVTITGILPADLGQINLNDNGTASINGSSFPIFPNQQIRVTHNISTVDKDKSASLLSGLPKILGLDDIIKNNSSDQKANDEHEEKSISVEALANSDGEKEAR